LAVDIVANWPNVLAPKSFALYYHQIPTPPHYTTLSWVESGNASWGGRLNTIDLLVLTSLYQFRFILKMFLPLLQNRLPWWGGQLYWAFPILLVFFGGSLNIVTNTLAYSFTANFKEFNLIIGLLKLWYPRQWDTANCKDFSIYLYLTNGIWWFFQTSIHI